MIDGEDGMDGVMDEGRKKKERDGKFPIGLRWYRYHVCFCCDHGVEWHGTACVGRGG